jgi:4-amino-4-deoxy-L-arabinose transferase-like glycosyltransferase
VKPLGKLKQRPAAWIKILWAAGVLGVGLALRLVYLASFQARIPHAPYFFPPRVPHQPSEKEVLLTGASLSDSHAYEKLALNLLDHGVYTWQDSAPYTPTAYIPPGYPLFIAAVYGLLGRSPWNVTVVQLILSLFMIGLIFFWSQHRWGLKVAVPASLLFALNPVSVGFSSVLMGETLGAFFFLVAMLLFLETFEVARWWKVLLVGVLLGLAALVRAATLYFVVILLLPLLLHRALKFSKRLLLSAVFLGGFLVPVGGWMLRNRVTTGSLHFAGIMGYNLL